jgi:hypothetical protein
MVIEIRLVLVAINLATIEKLQSPTLQQPIFLIANHVVIEKNSIAKQLAME